MQNRLKNIFQNNTMKQVGYFSCTKPCTNCPYRTDASVQHWHKEHFEDLLKSESDYLGKIYLCHKNNGSACIGWLMDQDKNNFPSIALRIKLTTERVGRKYLDKLKSPVKMYASITKMVKANFPELIK
jgi:hypothetical protein